MNSNEKTREELLAELAQLNDRLAGLTERLNLLESAAAEDDSRATRLEGDLRLARVLAESAADSLDTREVARLLAREIQRVFDSHSVNLYVITSDGTELEMQNIGLTPGIMNAAERALKMRIPLIRVPKSGRSSLWRTIVAQETKVWRTGEEVAQLLREFAAAVPPATRRLMGDSTALVNRGIKILALECTVHVPLYSGGRAVGLLAVSSREQIPDDDVARLESIGQHVASILATARLEQDWRRERDRADAYMKAAPGFMLVLDTEGRVQAISHVGCEILELPQEKIIGRNWAESFIPERFRESGRKRISAILSGDSDEVFDGHALTAHGEVRVVRWRAAALRGVDGEVTGLFATGTDLTRIAESEKRTLHARRRYQALVEHSSDLTFIIGADGILKYASPSALRTLGYPRSEIIGKHGATIIHPDDAALFTRAMQEAQQPETTIGGNYAMRLRCRDGSWRLLEGRGNQQFDNPDIAGIILNLRDATERERMEGSIEHSAARFRALIQNSHDLMMVLGPDLHVRYASPSCARDLGYTLDALQGVGFEELVHGEDLDRDALRQSGEAGGTPIVLRMRLRAERRQWLWYNVTVTNLVEDPTINGYILNAIRAPAGA